MHQGGQERGGGRGNETVCNHTASLIANTVLFLGTDNIKINKTREPSANSRQLAWAWRQMSGDPGSFWRQVQCGSVHRVTAVQCGSVHRATAVTRTVRSTVSLQFSFWLFPTSDYRFQQNVGHHYEFFFCSLPLLYSNKQSTLRPELLWN